MIIFDKLLCTNCHNCLWIRSRHPRFEMTLTVDMEIKCVYRGFDIHRITRLQLSKMFLSQSYCNRVMFCVSSATHIEMLSTTWTESASWVVFHTMDLLWEKFQWILPLYMKPISFQSKASVVCSVTAAMFIGFCLKKLTVFSQHIGKKTMDIWIPQNKSPGIVYQLSVLITSWDII